MTRDGGHVFMPREVGGYRLLGDFAGRRLELGSVVQRCARQWAACPLGSSAASDYGSTRRFAAELLRRRIRYRELRHGLAVVLCLEHGEIMLGEVPYLPWGGVILDPPGSSSPLVGPRTCPKCQGPTRQINGTAGFLVVCARGCE